jgi:Condensation domain
MTSRGPLSWQQAVNLRRNRQLGVGNAQLVAVLPWPVAVPVTRLRERLAAIVGREEALQITELPGDGYGAVTYDEEIDLPISTERADSVAHVDTLISGMQEPRFTYDDHSPLWKVAVVEHPDRAGKPARTVCVALDHHLVDGRSTRLLRAELVGRASDRWATRRGGYRGWVTSQRERFPMEDPTGVPTPAREFWRRYFDGGAPNHAVIPPFCDPVTPLSGLEHIMRRDQTVPAAALKAAAGRHRCTAFLLFAASVAAAVSHYTTVDDLTLRYFAHGRTPHFLATLGWFADHVPLRIRGTGLDDPHRALRAAIASRSELLPHEATPWGYIMAVCSQTDAERPQIAINFGRIDAASPLSGPQDTTIASSRGYLDLSLAVPPSGNCILQCRFDPKRFSQDGVEAFVKVILERLRQLIQG